MVRQSSWQRESQVVDSSVVDRNNLISPGAVRGPGGGSDTLMDQAVEEARCTNPPSMRSMPARTHMGSCLRGIFFAHGFWPTPGNPSPRRLNSNASTIGTGSWAAAARVLGLVIHTQLTQLQIFRCDCCRPRRRYTVIQATCISQTTVSYTLLTSGMP
jgi:hypothetical protein